MVPVMARQMGLSSLGTFHQRQGDQFLLSEDGLVPAGWGRLFGEKLDQQSRQIVAGTSFDLASDFDGHIWGIQAGIDILAREFDDASKVHAGLFYTHAETKGDITAFTLAIANNRSSDLDLKGDSAGAYATYVGRAGWYVDAVGMYTWLNGSTTSSRGIGADFDGNAILASLELGYPIPLGDGWRLEPQVQGIWQQLDFDDSGDRFTHIAYEKSSTFTGRLGLRAEGTLDVSDMKWQPYADLNLWHDFNKTQNVTFNRNDIAIRYGGTVLELGGGIAGQINTAVGIYAAVSIGTNLDKEDHQTVGGNIGMRIRW